MKKGDALAIADLLIGQEEQRLKANTRRLEGVEAAIDLYKLIAASNARFYDGLNSRLRELETTIKSLERRAGIGPSSR